MGNINPRWINPQDFMGHTTAFRAYAAEAIPAGSIVYISGSENQKPEVSIAKADDAAKIKGKLYLCPNLAPAGGATIVTDWSLVSTDTTGATVGDFVYLSKTGTPILVGDLTTEIVAYVIGSVYAVGATGYNTLLDLRFIGPSAFFDLYQVPGMLSAYGNNAKLISVDVETTEIVMTVPVGFDVKDIWLVKSGAGSTSAQILVKNNTTTIATFDVSASADNAVVRAATLISASLSFASGGTIKFTPSGTGPNAQVNVLMVPSLA